jgi:hypothetical protein
MNTMAFSEADYDRILKERWRRNMKDDIVEHKEKHEKEVGKYFFKIVY